MEAQQIKKVMAESLALPVEMFKDEASFDADLGADSLDIVEMWMSIEDEFGVEIPDWQAEKVTTVQQAVELVTLLAASAPRNYWR